MSQSYLDKFRSKIPLTQGNQLLRRLTTKKNSGEIRTLEEFKTQLKTLTTQLLEEKLRPTLSLLKAIPGQDISSTQFNEMLERIDDDLETAFVEANNLDEIIETHHKLIQQVSLKAIRFALNKLRAKVSLYEFINSNEAGFNEALYNTFTEAESLQTTRSSEVASLVFVDPRTSSTISNSEDAFIDLVGERLTLGGDQLNYIEPKNIEWLANENSVRGEINVEFENTDIKNLLDNTKNTFWVVAILQSSIKTSGVSVEIRLTLPGVQDVNFVEVEPATDTSLILTNISYFSAFNQRLDVNVSDTTISGPTRVNFQKVAAKDLILRFRQDNYKEVQYTEKLAKSNFHKALVTDKAPAEILDVSEDLQETLSSDFLLSTVFKTQNTTGKQKKYFQYLVGFDNVRVGHHTYDDRSIFVSSKKTANKPGVVGIKVEETRPVQLMNSDVILSSSYLYPPRDSAEDSKIYHGAVEYWLAVQSFSPTGFIVATDIIPILPYMAKRIYHECLVLTHKSSTSVVSNNMGSLMFYADANSNDILVYKNGVQLEYSTDWTFVADGTNDEITLETPGSEFRMRRGIQIQGTVSPLDIYTVSYTPRTSNSLALPSDTTLFNVVDLTGDQTIRMTKDNIIVMDKFRGSYEVDKADFYLIIIFRKTSAINNFSPAVEEFTLATGSRGNES